MKELKRVSPPDCFDNSIKKSKEQKIKYYKNLRDSKGNIKNRWTTTCKDNQDKISKIKKRVFDISNGKCAYCGKNITLSEMDIDHFLPKESFNYLAYCFDNYLPSCKVCNQNVKGSFTPKSLKVKKIIEDILKNESEIEYDLIYDKNYIFNTVAKNDRLLEPSFDKPSEHLEFNCEFLFYEAKSKIGETTIATFFDKKEIAKEWEKISLHIKDLVLLNASKNTIDNFADLHGYEFLCNEFYNYWIEEKKEGRIVRV